MTDKTDIKKLNDYRCQINDLMIGNIKESVIKLNDAMSMIIDLQSINEALVSALLESENEKQNQTNELQALRKEMDELRKENQRIEEKEKQYDDLDLSMANVSALLADLQKKKRKLADEQKILKEEKKLFETEKTKIIDEKNEAEKKAGDYQKERNDAIRSRDVAIADYNKAITDKEEIEKHLNEVQDDVDWYRNYAMAVDDKIVSFFIGNNEGALYIHYQDYLINPDKLDEIHEHFPNYVLKKTGMDKDSNKDGEQSENGVDHQDGEQRNLSSNDKTDKQKKREVLNKKSDRPEIL